MLVEDFVNIKKIVGEYNEDLEPMMYCLNYCFGSNLLKTLEKIAVKQGFGGDNIGIFFPSDFETWDEDYFEIGVMFQWGSKGVIVDDVTFYKYIKVMTDASIVLFPDTKEKAYELLNKIKNNYPIISNTGVTRIIEKLSFQD